MPCQAPYAAPGAPRRRGPVGVLPVTWRNRCTRLSATSAAISTFSSEVSAPLPIRAIAFRRRAGDDWRRGIEGPSMVATTAEDASPAQATGGRVFRQAAILVVVGIMSTTLGQEAVLGA